MCLSQSLCLRRTFVEKVAPPPNIKVYALQTFLPQLLPLEKDSRGRREIGHNMRALPLCKRGAYAVKSFGGGREIYLFLICVFQNVSLANMGCLP